MKIRIRKKKTLEGKYIVETNDYQVKKRIQWNATENWKELPEWLNKAVNQKTKIQ